MAIHNLQQDVSGIQTAASFLSQTGRRERSKGTKEKKGKNHPVFLFLLWNMQVQANVMVSWNLWAPSDSPCTLPCLSQFSTFIPLYLCTVSVVLGYHKDVFNCTTEKKIGRKMRIKSYCGKVPSWQYLILRAFTQKAGSELVSLQVTAFFCHQE